MPAKDISSKSSCMERNSGILYKILKPVGTDPAAYTGVVRLASGEIYWASLWPRLVRGKPVVELRLTPKI